MPSKNKQPQMPLPKSWGTHANSAILHVVALAQYALTYSRSWAADSTNQRVRLKAENEQLEQELALRLPGRLGDGSLLPPRDGLCCVPEGTRFPRNSHLWGTPHAPGQGYAQVLGMRPRKAVLAPGVQGLVPKERDPTAVWGRGTAWQHCRGGTLHPDGEGRVYPKTPGVVPGRDVPAGVALVCRLLQPASAAYDVGRQDAR